MKKTLFIFDLEDEEEYQKAVDRVQMIIDQLEICDAYYLQDGYLKLQVNGLILHYRYGYRDETTFCFEQKVMESNRREVKH